MIRLCGRSSRRGRVHEPLAAPLALAHDVAVRHVLDGIEKSASASIETAARNQCPANVRVPRAITAQVSGERRSSHQKLGRTMDSRRCGHGVTKRRSRCPWTSQTRKGQFMPPRRRTGIFVTTLALAVLMTGCFGKILSQRSEFGEFEFEGEAPRSSSTAPSLLPIEGGTDAREPHAIHDAGAKDATTDTNGDANIEADVVCSEQPRAPATTCSLGFGAPMTPLRIQVRAPCTTPALDYGCVLKPDLLGQRLLVSLVSKTCTAAINDACEGRVIDCAVPPLPPNLYSIYFEGEGNNPLQSPNPRVLLYVVPDGTEAACVLPAPGRGYAVDLSQAPKDCAKNSDCAVVLHGDMCATCPESTAVARRALLDVDLAHRQALSRCEYTPGRGYKYCPQFRAVCNAEHQCQAEPAPPL